MFNQGKSVIIIPRQYSMNVIRANQSGLVTGDLRLSEGQLRLAIGENAVMIWFVVGTDQFNFSTKDDDYHKIELRRLKRYVRSGEIESASPGGPILIDGVHLYPIEVKYAGNIVCPAYALLRRQGSVTDAEKVPYFFRSEAKRNEVMQYLTRF